MGQFGDKASTVDLSTVEIVRGERPQRAARHRVAGGAVASWLSCRPRDQALTDFRYLQGLAVSAANSRGAVLRLGAVRVPTRHSTVL